ncbi:MAG: hypothetical protein K9K93_07995 [Acholeplasmataceae bacterium]|nr:hypothetical protein [Acholeplasmataceae bacterium]
MAQNKRKVRRVFITYVIVMQLFFTVIGLALLGVYIGYQIDPEGIEPSVYGGLGLFLGIMVSFYTLWQFIKSEARHANRS